MASSIRIGKDGEPEELGDTSLHAEIGLCDEDEVCVDSLYSIQIQDGMVLIANCVKKRLFVDAGLWRDEWDDEPEGGAEKWEKPLSDIPEEEEEGEGSFYSALNASDQGTPPDGKGGTQGQSGQGPGVGSGEKKASGEQTQSESHDLPDSLFAGKYASVVLTKDEAGTTPLEVEGIGLRSLGNGTALSAGGGGASGSWDVSESPIRNTGNKAPTAPAFTGQERNCTVCMDLKTFKPFTPDTKALEMEVKMVGTGSAALAGVLWVALLSG